VFEGDVLTTSVELGAAPGDGTPVTIAATTAKAGDSTEPVVVQQWRPVVLGGA
jgi:hypothetical protein